MRRGRQARSPVKRVVCQSGPSGSRIVALITLVLVAGFGYACGGGKGPTAPRRLPDPVPLSEVVETADITFRFAAGDSVNAEWQQAFHDWATALLEVSLPQRLEFHKYLSVGHQQQVTGTTHWSWADVRNYTVHTPAPQHGHEAMHVYTYVIGWPTDYFLEGVATGLHLDPFTGDGPFFENIDGDNVHDLSRGWLLQDELYEVESIFESETFWSPPVSRTYPQAGSFVNFLFVEYGVDKLISLIAKVDHEDSAPTIKGSFRSIYGLSVAEAESRWHVFLRDWEE